MYAHSCRVYVRVSGLRIAYRRTGAGEPVLFLHGGFGFDSRSWARQFDGLADEFDVVAWDAPGCGESDDPPARFGMADYGDCVAGLVRELGLDPPHIVGLSFGSAVALSCYARHPELARSLVLAGAYAGWAGSLPRDELERRVAHVTEYAARPIEDWVAAYLPSMFSNSASPEAVAEAHELMSDARPAPCLTGLRAMADADLRDVLARIDVPTLLLYGEHESRSPVTVGQALHAAIGNARLVVLPHAGHLSNIEAPMPSTASYAHSFARPGDRRGPAPPVDEVGHLECTERRRITQRVALGECALLWHTACGRGPALCIVR